MRPWLLATMKPLPDFYTTGDIDIVGRAAGAGVLVWTNLSGENKAGYMVMPDAEVALGDAVAASSADYKLVPDATDGVLMLLPQKPWAMSDLP